jgi:hypothetical protein
MDLSWERYDRAVELVRKPLPFCAEDHQELRKILPLLNVHQLMMLANQQERAHPVLKQ